MLTNPEQGLIGSILLEPADSFEVIEALGVTPADLSHEDTRLMLTKLLAMRAKGDPIDQQALSNEMPPRFMTNVWQVTDQIRVPNAGYYGSAIMEMTKRRELADLGERLMKAAVDTEIDLEKVQDQALSSLSKTQGKGLVTKSETLQQAAARVMNDLDNAPRFIPTPWPALNNVIGGLRPGAMYVLAARPGVGKSLLALQLAEAIAKPDSQVAFFSFEMNSGELASRALASKAGINISKIDRRELTEGDKEKLAQAYRNLNPNLHLIVTPSREVTQLRPALRNINRQTGNALGAIFIDYLQQMDAKAPSLYERVTAISGQLKSLAMELDVPVFVLAQLNREAEKRPGPPVLADLRDSGAIEQDADVVLMLSNAQSGSLSLWIHKNRQGPGGVLKGTIDHPTMTLLDLVKA
jgi:replicative DNA helicase